MSLIIGRKKEQETLNEILRSTQAEFLVAYGRRRVGKTFLISEFYMAQNCLYFEAIGIEKGSLETQLNEFSKSMKEAFDIGFDIATPTSWMKALETLTELIDKSKSKQKVVLFFDEFPWMATARSGLLKALGYYWNKHWSRNKRVKLILCGSSASWIIKKILHNKGGLHNRTTYEMNLAPFSLSETNDFLASKKIKLQPDRLLELYMAIGGIPHYLNRVKRGVSIQANINQLCFHQRAPLLDEFDKLFDSLFKHAQTYKEIIREIAKHRYGVGRSILAKQLKHTTDGGTLTNRLNDLEAAGFIKEFTPITNEKRGVYYRLIDEYCDFYLKWIEPERKSLLMSDDNNQYWMRKSNSPAYSSWAGFAFESICYKHIGKIREAIDIQSAYRVGTWRYASTKIDQPGAQIDLLFECDDGVTYLIEIKNTKNPYVLDKEAHLNLLNKIKCYQQATNNKNDIHVVLLSANGLKPSIYSEESIVKVITLADLY